MVNLLNNKSDLNHVLLKSLFETTSVKESKEIGFNLNVTTLQTCSTCYWIRQLYWTTMFIELPFIQQ